MNMSLARVKNSMVWRFRKLVIFFRVFRYLFSEFPEDFEMLNRNSIYDFFSAKYFRLPRVVRRHRKYFSKKSRGFGEDAFHAAWTLVFNKYDISNCLEIGVYRGQTISLWALLAKLKNRAITVVGISPMSPAGDSVSKYLDIDYEKDILKNFDKFTLNRPVLIKGFSQSSEAKSCIESGNWDLVYIDGSHELDVCISDLRSAEKGLRSGGVLVVDDSSLYSDFSRSFKGHPGPSRAVTEFLPDGFKHILAVGHNNFFEKI